MNKSQKIYLSSGDTGNDNQDKYIKVKLEQDIETLEFMSLRLGTADVYQNFNSDYGVLVGRVIANGGIGIPNAKISIFIPIDDVDAQDPNIYSFYPYKTPRDKNNDGKRYNLLPRVSVKNPETNQLEPKQAFGSFPIKEEIVGNLPFLDVYKKYYKYTALTNIAGDYMIFGVPVGTQTVHLSCDITDIGEYSMNPASMIVNLGYSESQFIDRGTRIKPSDDLSDLPNIETQEITVDIRPFWGDAENFEIGIVRQDFRIRALLTNTFTIFGSTFADSSDTMRGSEDDDKPREREIRDLYMIYPNAWTDTVRSSNYGLALANKRIGYVKETIYYYPPDITDDEINVNSGNADPTTDMLILDPNEYSAYYRNGDFAFIINCNRDRVVTDDFGNQIPVDYDDPNGVFTTFRGFVTLEYTLDEAPMTSLYHTDKDNESGSQITGLRLRFKFPQHAPINSSFNYSGGTNADTWRKQHMKFEAQKFYSFSKFHACIANNVDNDNNQWGNWNGFFNRERDVSPYINLNYPQLDNKFNIGPIQVSDYADYPNSDYQMVDNVNLGGAKKFGANWLNLCVYFPQTGYWVTPINKVSQVRTSSFLATQWENQGARNSFFVTDNSMPLAGGNSNTKWFGRSDLHWTDIIEVPLDDIVAMKGYPNKGFTNLQVSNLTLANYRNGNTKPPTTDWKGTWSANCPFSGGKVNGVPTGSNDTKFYFYKGFGQADCIEFLYDLGLVTE